jgi:hypothetical protein
MPPRILQCTIHDPSELHVGPDMIGQLLGDVNDGAVLVAVARFSAPAIPSSNVGPNGPEGVQGAPDNAAPPASNGGLAQLPPPPVMGHGFFAVLPLGGGAVPSVAH